jgi:phosphatidylserine/phosphatidylglycerophosphate/cardiolipin synthase-like enzyme
VGTNVVRLCAAAAALAAGIAVTGVAVAGSAPGTVASEPVPDPVFGAPVFNDPMAQAVADEYAIFRQLAGIMDRVPAGQDIEMSWFEFPDRPPADTAEHPDITNRLLLAHRRGVNVRMILDSRYGSGKAIRSMPTYRALLPELGDDDRASSYVLLCPDQRGCIANRTLPFQPPLTSYNHDKFLAASRVRLDDGTVQADVVFQSSGNLGDWDAQDAYNNAITWSEPGSYEMYRQYFADLRDKRKTANKADNDYYRVGDSSLAYKPYLLPRQEAAGANLSTDPTTDPVVDLLAPVKCAYPGDDGKRHQTAIRLAEYYVSRVAVADRLAALVKAGCWVDIVYTTMSAGVSTALHDVGGKPIGLTLCKPVVPAKGRTVYVHDKYLLVNGGYGDDTVPRVYTGSHNLSISSLRNADESFVRVMGADVHAAYLRNFYHVRDWCKANPTAPTTAQWLPAGTPEQAEADAVVD